MRSRKCKALPCIILPLLLIFATTTQATLVRIDNCSGAAISCNITTSPPNPIVANPNDNLLLAWDEVQNFTLTQDLIVNRVFDPNASFVTNLNNGTFAIAAGTIVSSHYLQWDPDTAPNTGSNVQASVVLDSQVFAFITGDQTLASSDYLGLSGVNYNGFGLRGLEGSDVTNFNGNSTDLDWFAGNPGDWARLITAFSPSAPIQVNSPSLFALLLFASGILFFKKGKHN